MYGNSADNYIVNFNLFLFKVTVRQTSASKEQVSTSSASKEKVSRSSSSMSCCDMMQPEREENQYINGAYQKKEKKRSLLYILHGAHFWQSFLAILQKVIRDH
jgi:hypothetical protein